MKDNAVLKYLICGVVSVSLLFYHFCSLFLNPYGSFNFQDIFEDLWIVLDIAFCVLLLVFSIMGINKTYKHILFSFSGFFFLCCIIIMFENIIYNWGFSLRLILLLFLYFLTAVACALPAVIDLLNIKNKEKTMKITKYISIGLAFIYVIVVVFLFSLPNLFYYIDEIRFAISGSYLYYGQDDRIKAVLFFLSQFLRNIPFDGIAAIIFLFLLKVKKDAPDAMSVGIQFNNASGNLYSSANVSQSNTNQPINFAPVYNQPAPQPVYNPYVQSPVYNQPAQVTAPQSTIQTANNQSGFDMFEEKTVGIFSSSYNQPQSVINSAPAYTSELNGQTNEQLPKPKFCGFCGAKLPDGVLFCTQCGKKIV